MIPISSPSLYLYKDPPCRISVFDKTMSVYNQAKVDIKFVGLDGEDGATTLFPETEQTLPKRGKALVRKLGCFIAPVLCC